MAIWGSWVIYKCTVSTKITNEEGNEVSEKVIMRKN